MDLSQPLKEWITTSNNQQRKTKKATIMNVKKVKNKVTVNSNKKRINSNTVSYLGLIMKVMMKKINNNS